MVGTEVYILVCIALKYRVLNNETFRNIYFA